MINKEDILLKTNNGYDILNHYLGGYYPRGHIIAKKAICSPFRDDKTPSFNCYENGTWHTKDFGDDRFNFDCFSLVRYQEGIEDFPKILEFINQTFILGLDNDAKPKIKKIPKPKPSQEAKSTAKPNFEQVKPLLEDQSSNFHKFIIDLGSQAQRPKEAIQEHLQTWKVGTNAKRFGNTVFGLANAKGKILNLKTIPYTEDGKRIKDKGCFYLPKMSRCLYGLHLYDPKKPVVLVESEKTAVITSLLASNDFNYLATGGANGFTKEMIEPILGNEIYFFCDNDEAGKNNSTIKYLNEFLEEGKIKLKIVDAFSDYTKGYDLADYYIEEILTNGYDIDLSFFVKNTVDKCPYVISQKKEEEEKPPDKDNNVFESIFKGNTLNKAIERAKNAKPLKPYFGNFLHSGELVFFFGDTGVGKSILAIQICEAIALGRSEFKLQNAHPPQKVLFYDFELTERNFLHRYSNESGVTYQFSDNLYRMEIDLTTIDFKQKDYSELLANSMRFDIQKYRAEVIVIDNITGTSLNSLSDGDTALSLIRKLDEIKKELEVTILVLAHTPKIPVGTALHLNHLAGSKHLSNFADGIFAIGKSTSENNERYLKHLKCRNAEMLYHENNVITLELKKEDNFLGFHLLGFDSEQKHLMSEEQKQQQKEKGDRIAAVRDMVEEGMTQKQIAEQLAISQGQVSKIIKRHNIH